VKDLKNVAREAGEKKISKFTESAWKLTYYLATEVFVVLITYNEPWFGNTAAFWHGWPYQTVKYVRHSTLFIPSSHEDEYSFCLAGCAQCFKL